MRSDCLKLAILLAVALPVTWILSCSGRPGGTRADIYSKTSPVVAGEPDAKLIRLTAPAENASFRLNGTIKVIIEPEGKSHPDSLKIWFDGKEAALLRNSPWEYEIPSSFTLKTGRKALKVTAYRRGTKPQTITCFVIIYSDTAPRRNSFRIINSFPHDREAFTQGLVYHKGYLYEGTGQETRSNLRKVELATGQVLNQHNLEAKLFGEGIAILNGKIYQLTWQSKVGFVYDLETFRMINRFYYQAEGWGLTAMDDKLVMSDGSNILYIVDPDMFMVVSQVEVYDNRAKVSDLNELEYVNGEIWANIWQTDLIARIDPVSGKVIAYIDLKGIMNDPSFDTSVNVLNGIAFDQETGRIFVTGKNWPRLFEIQIIE